MSVTKKPLPDLNEFLVGRYDLKVEIDTNKQLCVYCIPKEDFDDNFINVIEGCKEEHPGGLISKFINFNYTYPVHSEFDCTGQLTYASRKVISIVDIGDHWVVNIVERYDYDY